jgi:carboxylesterase type B
MISLTPLQLVGQSAGAMSILLLSTLPAALGPTPLFTQAIVCSPVGLHYRCFKVVP